MESSGISSAPIRAVALLALVLVAVARAFCGESKEAALSANLATIRQVIATYSEQHGGALPGQEGWDELVRQLTTRTDVDGHLGTEFGPYLVNAWPLNPLTGDASGVVEDSLRTEPTRRARSGGLHAACELGALLREVLTGDAAEPSWIYCRTTGEFRANVKDAGPSGIAYFSL